MARAEPRYAARTRYWPAGRRRNSLRKCPRCMATRAPRTWTHPRAVRCCSRMRTRPASARRTSAADEHGARQAALGLRPATLDVHRRGRHGMGSGLHHRLASSPAQRPAPGAPVMITAPRPPLSVARGARGAGGAGGAGREINRRGCCRPACSPGRSRARSRAAASPQLEWRGPSGPRAGRRSPSTSRRASCPARSDARRVPFETRK